MMKSEMRQMALGADIQGAVHTIQVLRSWAEGARAVHEERIASLDSDLEAVERHRGTLAGQRTSIGGERGLLDEIRVQDVKIKRVQEGRKREMSRYTLEKRQFHQFMVEAEDRLQKLQLKLERLMRE